MKAFFLGGEELFTEDTYDLFLAILSNVGFPLNPEIYELTILDKYEEPTFDFLLRMCKCEQRKRLEKRHAALFYKLAADTFKKFEETYQSGPNLPDTMPFSMAILAELRRNNAMPNSLAIKAVKDLEEDLSRIIKNSKKDLSCVDENPEEDLPYVDMDWEAFLNAFYTE
jgi:hypothetical protein